MLASLRFAGVVGLIYTIVQFFAMGCAPSALGPIAMMIAFLAVLNLINAAH